MALGGLVASHPASFGGLGPISPLPTGAGLVAEFFGFLTSFVIQGAVGLIDRLGTSLNAAGRPDFGAGFGLAFAEMIRIAELVALPFLLLAALQAILRHDLSGLLRAVFLRLPAAALLSAAATALVSLMMALTDEASSALLVRGGPSLSQLLSNLTALLSGSGSMQQVMGSFAGVLIAGIAVVIAAVLWFELAFRSAAISLATLFLPLALVGVLWSATAHWARRLGETIAALVLSKLVVVAVLVLAADTAGPAGGLTGAFQALALLALAVFSPFTLFRLIPLVDNQSLAAFEGLGRRATRAVAGAGYAFSYLTARPGAVEEPSPIDLIPWATNEDGLNIGLDDPSLQARVDELRRHAAELRASAGEDWDDDEAPDD